MPQIYIKKLQSVWDCVIINSCKLKEQLEAVKNFAFVLGLVDVSRRRAMPSADKDIHADDEQTLQQSYPLVMDAPFSHIDAEHVNNVSKAVSEIAEQVVLIVMPKDWPHAKGVLQDKVGKLYRLDKKSETYSTFKEENDV